MRCYCSEGGNFGLCPELLYDCECLGSGGTIFEDAAASRRMIRRLANKKIDGLTCAGYVRKEAIEWSPGVWRCHPGCDDEERRKGFRVAVPGTPCSGYELGERRRGRWVPVAAH